MFKAYWNKNVFREIYLIFFPKIKRKFKRKHAGKYNGIKAPGKFKFSEKKSHKMLNVIRFKQVQTHGDIHNVPQFLTAPFGFDQKLKEEKDQSC